MFPSGKNPPATTTAIPLQAPTQARKDELALPPLRTLPPPPTIPIDSFGFPRQNHHHHHHFHQPPILPPPIPTTLNHPSALLPAYSVSLPPLPLMATNQQASASATVMQQHQPPPPPQSIIQQRYYPQQQPSTSSYPSNIVYHATPPAATPQSGNPASATARPAPKEIKRRTKTGCLTCRKRRIKCDERRPICRNCEKSKRECEGYDPIFRGSAHPSSIPQAMQSSTQNFNDFASIDPTLNEAAGGRLLPGEYDPTSQALLTAPPLNIEDILNVGSGIPPPAISTPNGLEAVDRENVKNLFEHLYAPAIDKFLETRWFSTRGLHHLFNNTLLLEKFKILKSRFIYTPGNNMHEFLTTQSLEAHVVWESMLLARQVSLSIAATNDPAANTEIAEGINDVAKRIDVFEALVTNQRLDPGNALPEPPRSGATTPAGKPALQPQLLSREQNFWYLTSKFCSMRDDSKRFDENPVEDIEKTLLDMRLLLDSRENRDIVYSIAVVRHFGHKMADKAAAQGLAQVNIGKNAGNDEEDPTIKVEVARRFIQEEANGKGTNQVTQRVCGMAVMSWTKR